MRGRSRVFRIAVCAAIATAAHATESIEYVGEHLAEIPMDNRYASLPLWGQPATPERARWFMTTQAAFAHTQSGGLAVDGPLYALGVSRRVSADWKLTGLAFFDDLDLSASLDRRPLEVKFAEGVPLSLPAEAEFTGLSGTARSTGIGFGFRRSGEMRLWHAYEFAAGVLWHRVELRNYSFDFRILEGPDAGATGVLDYSATYNHTVPYIGIAWPRERGNWGFTPHVQAAIPLPRRGVEGHIRGPGYDLQGDTGKAGADTPFGDPSVTFGFDVAYRPWNLVIDVGTLVSQAVVEPLIHKGIEENWMLSLSWSY